MLEFDVTQQGTVENASIIDDDGSGCFNRMALKTIGKFKYKPTTVDGRALRSEGVRFRMAFSLEG